MFDDDDRYCPTAHCYSAVARALYPVPSPSPSLPCTKPEITQDGNVTVPIVGGAGNEEGESTKPIIIEDGNATLPIIVGGVDGEEGRDLGVVSVPQNEVVVQHNRITVTLEDIASHEYFFGEEQSVTVTASSAHESASATRADDEDTTRGKRLQPAFPLPSTRSLYLVHDGFVPSWSWLSR